MELILLLSCALIITTSENVYGAAINSNPAAITLDDLTSADQKLLKYFEQRDNVRNKRSGDLLSMLKTKISEGIKSKIGHIASASSYASSGQHGHQEHYHHPYPPISEHHEEKSFNFWELQKSVLFTLLQAVKAIKGGLLAVKGHLIKGGGYLISAKGKLITMKGEALSKLGKNIATSALLSPASSYRHEEPVYGPPSISYSGPNGHEAGAYTSSNHGPYSTSSFTDHNVPPNIQALIDHLPRGIQQGILVLKKIPKGHKTNNGNDDSHSFPESHISDIQPEEHSVLSPYSKIKDFLSASAWKEHSDESPAHLPSAPEDVDDESFHDHNPVLSHHDIPDQNHHLHAAHSDFYNHDKPSLDNHVIHEDPSNTYNLHSETDTILSQHELPYKTSNLQPPATSYGTPIPYFENKEPVKEFHSFHKYPLVHNQHFNSHDGSISHYPIKLDTYEPLQLPNYKSKPFTSVGVSTLGSYGSHNFRSYPINLSHTIGARHRSLDYYNNRYNSGPYK